MEAQKRIDECGFSRAVRTKQSDRASPQRAGQILQDVTLAEADRESVQFNNRSYRSSNLGLTRCVCCSGLNCSAHAEINRALLRPAGMAHGAQKHLRWKPAALPQRHQSTEIEAHEASIARHHNPLRLAIHINQSRCSVGLQSRNRLLLLLRERSHLLDLIHQWTNHRSDVVIENAREVRVSIARQQRLEGLGMSQRVPRLAVANRMR